MKGSHRIIVESRKVKYDFVIHRNITIITGDSGSGKTVLIDLIHDYGRYGADSGVFLSCDCPCKVIDSEDWERKIEETTGSIIFIDEGNRFLVSKKFAQLVQGSDNYFVLATREKLPALPYSVSEIYGFRKSGKFHDAKQKYNEIYHMYLCKIAMDIVAKHIKADKDGVRIAELDEMSYRRKLWSHRPLTDFWRVGKGYAKKLEEYGLYTMGDIARCSIGKENELYNEDLLYKLFGVNAELLIDHAWGYEPCTMKMVKAYKPETNSVCSGQVLHCPYDFEKAKLVVKEMTDQMVLDLVDKKLVTDQIVLTVGYDIENLNNTDRKKKYHGEVTIDRYGRRIPKHAHGTTNLKRQTSSTKMITDAVIELYDGIVDRNLLIRRINITANRLVDENSVKKEKVYEQLDLFTDYEAQRKKQEEEEAALDREKRMQEAMLSIKKKFGKNAMLKGMNLQEGATARDRNEQIGGHKA